MKLVKDNAVFLTLQGEGTRVGRPAVFVRLWGCDYSCDWCDTKDSWKPGSEFVEETALTVAERVHSLVSGCRFTPDIVITGGNPMLQLKDIVLLLQLLEALLRKKFHVTFETQGTLGDMPQQYVPHWFSFLRDEGFQVLVSVSPKFHDWPSLSWMTEVAWNPPDSDFQVEVQYKLVVTDEVSDDEIDARIQNLRRMSVSKVPPSIILQPLYQLGSDCIQRCSKLAMKYGDVLCIPQMHKKVYRLP